MGRLHECYKKTSIAQTWSSSKDNAKGWFTPEKRMLSVWWGVQGVLYWELVPENTTITGTMYRAQLNKLAAEIKSKGLQRGKIYFQHDNAKLQ